MTVIIEKQNQQNGCSIIILYPMFQTFLAAISFYVPNVPCSHFVANYIHVSFYKKPDSRASAKSFLIYGHIVVLKVS